MQGQNFTPRGKLWPQDTYLLRGLLPATSRVSMPQLLSAPKLDTGPHESVTIAAKYLSLKSLKQGCQMTKNYNLGRFSRALDWENGYILWPFGIFYRHLVHFVFIRYIFSGCGIMDQEKSGNPGLKCNFPRERKKFAKKFFRKKIV
jgi:hypothetical protein